MEGLIKEDFKSKVNKFEDKKSKKTDNFVVFFILLILEKTIESGY